MSALPPIQDFEAFEAEVTPLLAPAFTSAFGGRRWQEMGGAKVAYEWLVKGLIARREVSFLAGPSQSGKSFLATDLALCIARGIDWFGRKVRRGAVVYIAAESAQGVINLRLPAYSRHHDLPYSADVPLLTLSKSPNFYRDEEAVKRLIVEIKAYERFVGTKVELVVIDTFSAATRGADEIKGVDMSKVHDRVKMIVDQCLTGVMVVHHMNKEGTSMRGHGSLFGDVDSVITCQIAEGKKDADDRQVRTARADKVKEGANKHKIEFVLRQVHLGQDEDGDEITSCVVQAPQKADYEMDPETSGAFKFQNENARLLFRCLLDAVREHGRAPPAGLKTPYGQKVVDQARWREIYARQAPQDEQDDAARRAGRVRQAIHRAITKFVNCRLIGHDSGLVWLTGRPVEGFNTSPDLRAAPVQEPAAPPAAGDFDDITALTEIPL